MGKLAEAETRRAWVESAGGSAGGDAEADWSMTNLGSKRDAPSAVLPWRAWW
jgi:hypothetical protein